MSRSVVIASFLATPLALITIFLASNGWWAVAIVTGLAAAGFLLLARRMAVTKSADEARKRAEHSPEERERQPPKTEGPIGDLE